MTKTAKQKAAKKPKPVRLWAVVIIPQRGRAWLTNELHFTRRAAKEAYMGEGSTWSERARESYGKEWNVRKVEVREL